MTLKDILHHRRSVRLYDPHQHIDTIRVRQCLELAQLAPTSSNLQLWECYHITNSDMLKRLGTACLGQTAATTAQEMVVFVTRPDYVKRHAKQVLAFEMDNVRRHAPAEKVDKRQKRWQMYYDKIMPVWYGRAFGLLGLLRKAVMQTVGVFKPVPRQVTEAEMNTVIHKSCALAAQTFMLAMAEVGYDTCPMEGFDSYRIKRLLGLPHAAGINMVVSCGIRQADGVWGDRYRVPFEEVYHRLS